MPEELSPESKLYVKEEIEKSRKEIKEEVEKVKSKVTKTFTTIAMIIGFLTGVGVYSFAKDYMKTTIQTAIDDKLGEQAVKEFKQRMIQAEGLVSDAKNLHAKIVKYEEDANEILSKLGRFEQDPNGYARFGEIMFSWGTVQSTMEKTGDKKTPFSEIPKIFAILQPERFLFKYPFDTNCLAVIPDKPGFVMGVDREGFWFRGVTQSEKGFTYTLTRQCNFMAIGH